jgi:hypothetical protein
MRVLVCGGRDYDDRKHVFATLDALHAKHPFDEVVEGGARGADELGRRWAKDRGVDAVTYWANWTKYDNRAGPIRNAKMLARGLPNLVVAFPGGGGTDNMVSQARDKNLEVIEVHASTPA